MLGKQIRHYRKNFGYTLQEMSAKTNLSVGYLSNIERDKASPTIETLEIICGVLRIDPVNLLMADRAEIPVVRAAEYKRLYSDADGILESIVVRNGTFRATCYTINDGYYEPVNLPLGGSSDIICYVLSGDVEIEMDGNAYSLSQGDTLFIKAFTPHTVRRSSDAVNKTLWIYLNNSVIDYQRSKSE